MREANGYSDNRHHIVHLQLVDDAEIPRFAELDVSANFQALWAYYDTDTVIELTIPAIRRRAGIRHVSDSAASCAQGAGSSGGSDYSVSSINPLAAIEVAITRRIPTRFGTPR